MLSHDNLLFSLKRNLINDPNFKLAFEDGVERMVSYLPLSHVAGLKGDLMFHLGHGGSVYFARPDALQGTLI